MAHIMYYITILLIISQSLAWSDTAHMLIAQIAKNEMQKEPALTKFQRANQLSCALNSLSDNRSQDFIQSSYWPEDVEVQSFFFWNNWHVAPVPVNPTGMMISYDPLYGTDNVVQGIEYCRQALVNDTGANYTENSMMLRLAINLIGDIHQPVHCAQFYNQTYPNGDSTGAQMFVNTSKIANISLYDLWERGVDIFASVDRPLNSSQIQHFSQWASNLTSSFPRTYFAQQLSNDQTPLSWGQESYDIAESFIYSNLESTNSVIGDFYNQSQKIAQERVVLAGYRLADWLNATIYSVGK